MVIHGKPGALLFAFQEYLGYRARIIGADVDEKNLFQTQNIEKYFVDQLKIETLQNLAKNLKDMILSLMTDCTHSRQVLTRFRFLYQN